MVWLVGQRPRIFGYDAKKVWVRGTWVDIWEWTPIRKISELHVNILQESLNREKS